MLALLCVRTIAGQTSAEITGTVLNAQSSEPLLNVEVHLAGRLERTHSGGAGRFSIGNLPSGDYVVQASAAGYSSIDHELHLEPGQTVQLEVALTPDHLRHLDSVSVNSSLLFNKTDENSLGGFTLAGSDVKNLGTVLADDPLRALQAVPGVTSNNDFEARFSVHGADPNRVGIYLDGIQLHQAIHTLEGTAVSGSNSIFNSDVISRLSLYDGVPPVRFGNNSAGALDVGMRDGNPHEYSFRATANFAYAGFMAQGPLRLPRPCSWIAAFRKSYLQYVLQQQMTDPAMSFGFQDGQGRLACKANANNTLTLELIDGNTGIDLSRNRAKLGSNSLMTSDQKLTVVNFGWQFIHSGDLLVNSHLGWNRNTFANANPTPAPLGSGDYNEWTWNTSAAWMWNEKNPLGFGVSARRMRDAGYLTQYNSLSPLPILNQYGGTGTLTSGFIDQGWTGLDGRLHLTVGGRWDRNSLDAISTFSPQAGLALRLSPSTQLQFGWGQYAQFPEVAQLTSTLGRRGLLPIRTTHTTAALERRLTDHVRLRATFYNRQDRDLLYQPFLDPRLINGVVFVPPPNPLYRNSVRGNSRGFEFLVQRSTVKGLTGWASYAYGRTAMHDGVTAATFPSDFDQRHTATAYLTYRIRPTVNLSSRWTYGSGYPLPAFLSAKEPYTLLWASPYILGDQRNRLRLPAYRRLDVQVSKSWTRSKLKSTLYAEVVNVENRGNYRFNSIDGVNPQSKVAFLILDKMFPILPSVGAVFEF